MIEDEPLTQPEPRNKTVSAAVTVSERQDIGLVSSAKRMSESDVLRDMTMPEIVAEAARIRQAAQEAA